MSETAPTQATGPEVDAATLEALIGDFDGDAAAPTAGAHPGAHDATDAVTGCVLPTDRDWLAAATDAATLDRERLRQAYRRFFLEGPAPEDAADEDDDEEVADDLAALRRRLPAADDEDDASGTDWDDIVEREEARDRAAEAQLAGADIDEDFVRWITYNGDRDVDLPAPSASAPSTLIAHRLAEHGLADKDIAMAKLNRPERLEELRGIENRALAASGGAFVSRTAIRIVKEEEAIWIIARLAEPGFEFRDVTLRGDDHRAAVGEIQLALSLLADGLEPGHLAVYHRHQFPTLRRLLWSKADVRSEASLPYDVLSGQRMHPLQEGFRDINRHAPIAINSDADFQVAVHSAPLEARIVVKPTDIRLGRLLWHVAELDATCIALERQRQEAINRLSEAGDVRMELVLSKSTLSDAFDAAVWSQYADWRRHLQLATTGSAGSRSLWADAVRSNLGNALAAFAVAPSEFALALEAAREARGDVELNLTHTHKTQGPAQWAAGYVAPDGDEPEDVLDTLKRAFVDHLSVLPQLRKAAFDTFMQQGVIVVRSYGGAKSSFPPFLAIDMVRESRSPVYLKLLEAETGRQVKLDFKCKVALRTALRLDDWVTASTRGCTPSTQGEWSLHFEDVLRSVCSRIETFVEMHVRRSLRRTAEQHHLAATVQRLGRLCEEGPYSPTVLAPIPAPGVPDRDLWDAANDDVEAVADTRRPRQQAAAPVVLGVYPAPNGTTFFSLVDGTGVPRLHQRWAECEVGTDIGLEQHLKQEHELVDALRAHRPAVIAVAVSGPKATKVFGDLKKLAADRLADELGVSVAVVWHAPIVATAAARSAAMEDFMPGMSLPQKIAACVGQSIQNPLFTIARLFDQRSSAKDLPVGCQQFSRSITDQPRLYRWMQWEMSLWVAAVGVDINALIVSPLPELVLQFVPGIGPRRSRHVLEVVQRRFDGQVTTRAALTEELSNFLGAPTRAVARNAAPCLRVIARETRPRMEAPHPLDTTLIPVEWYDDVAAMLAAGGLPDFLATALISEFVSTNRAIRQTWLLERHFDLSSGQFRLTFSDRNAIQAYYTAAHLDVHSAAWGLLAGFIVDQLVDYGVSTVLRPFRKLTAERFFDLTTNLTYSRGIHHDTPDDERVIYRGCPVEGFISRLRVNDKGVQVMAQLSIGIPALLDARDIHNRKIRESLEDYAAARRADKSGVKPTAPELNVGHVIHGTILSVNFARCEAKIAWRDVEVRPPRAETTAAASSNRSEGSAATFATEVLVRQGQSTALGYTRHPRSVALSSEDVRVRLSLPEIGLGEYLIRSSRVGGRAFVIVVKVSEEEENCAMDIACTELRDAGGRHVYRVDHKWLIAHDTDKERTYDSVDHIVERKVKRILDLLRTIRAHRKFYPSPSLANDSLYVQLHEDNDRLAYALTQRYDAKRQAHYSLVYLTKDLEAPRTIPIPFYGDGLGYFTRTGGLRECRDATQLIQLFKADYTAATRFYNGTNGNGNGNMNAVPLPPVPSNGAGSAGRRSGRSGISATAAARI
jgi:hypothetical protein